MTTQTLPELTGSEKQTAWAGKIRAALLQQFDAVIERNRERGDGTADYEAGRRVVAEQWTDAPLWIEARDRGPETLVMMFMEYGEGWLPRSYKARSK